MTKLFRHADADFASAATKTIEYSAMERRIARLPHLTHYLDPGNIRTEAFEGAMFRDRLGKLMRNLQGPSLDRAVAEADGRDMFDFAAAGTWARLDYQAATFTRSLTAFVCVVPSSVTLDDPGGVTEKNILSAWSDSARFLFRLINNAGSKTLSAGAVGQTAVSWGSITGSGKLDIDDPAILAVTADLDTLALKIWCNDFTTARASTTTNGLPSHPTARYRIGGNGLGNDWAGWIGKVLIFDVDLSKSPYTAIFEEVGGLLMTYYGI